MVPECHRQRALHPRGGGATRPTPSTRVRQPPFDRSPINGIRLVRVPPRRHHRPVASRPIVRASATSARSARSPIACSDLSRCTITIARRCTRWARRRTAARTTGCASALASTPPRRRGGRGGGGGGTTGIAHLLLARSITDRLIRSSCISGAAALSRRVVAPTLANPPSTSSSRAGGRCVPDLQEHLRAADRLARGYRRSPTFTRNT